MFKAVVVVLAGAGLVWWFVVSSHEMCGEHWTAAAMFGLSPSRYVAEYGQVVPPVCKVIAPLFG